jgi:glutamine synthetase
MARSSACGATAPMDIICGKRWSSIAVELGGGAVGVGLQLNRPNPTQRATGEMAMTPSEAKQFLADNKVKYVLAQFVDIHGTAKTKAVPAPITTRWSRPAPALPASRSGASASSPTSARTTWPSAMPGHPVAGALAARLRPHRLRRPRERRALAEYDPRGAEEADQAPHAMAGPSTPGWSRSSRCSSARSTARSSPPIRATRCPSPATTTRACRATACSSKRLSDSLRAVGIDVYQIDHEDANGQFEINYTFTDCLTSATTTLLQDGRLGDRQRPGHDLLLHAQALRQPAGQRHAHAHVDRRNRQDQPVRGQVRQARPRPVEAGLPLPGRHLAHAPALAALCARRSTATSAWWSAAR